MGQPYITFLRNVSTFFDYNPQYIILNGTHHPIISQVLALVVDPTNFSESKYPDDCKQRARDILDHCGGGSIGAYSDSAGIENIRQHVAEYIQRRDGGIPARWQDVYLCAGASQSIKSVMSLLNQKVDGLAPGILVPIPQYPLYSATIAEFGMSQVGYYLDEESSWGLKIDELEESLERVRGKCAPKAIVVINPGNPTGQVLTRENIEQVIKFAHKHRLFIFADEVYQDNVYDKQSTFFSFKSVLMQMGEPYASMELASFMSCSKGYMGECGIRGGYCELINLDPEVRLMYQKSLSAQLCPTTVGQAAIDCVVNPPREGEPSYELFQREKNAVLTALRERAKLVAETLNSFEGFSCNTVQGAMYAFPQVKLPPKALKAAKAAGKPADVFYAFQLLETTGGFCVTANIGSVRLCWLLIMCIFPQAFASFRAAVLARNPTRTISVRPFCRKPIS